MKTLDKLHNFSHIVFRHLVLEGGIILWENKDNLQLVAKFKFMFHFTVLTGKKRLNSDLRDPTPFLSCLHKSLSYSQAAI